MMEIYEDWTHAASDLSTQEQRALLKFLQVSWLAVIFDCLAGVGR